MLWNGRYNDNFTFYPHLATREMASALDPATISMMKFHSRFSFIDDPIILDDRDLITEFIDALRHAEGRECAVGIASDKLEIYVNVDGENVLAEMLWYFPCFAVDCHGPRFRKSLVKLGQLEAEKKKALLSQLHDDIAAVEFPLWCICDAERAKEFVRELQVGLHHCYAFTASTWRQDINVYYHGSEAPINLALQMRHEYERYRDDLPDELLESLTACRAWRPPVDFLVYPPALPK